jgi:cellulose synthase/poly-beta-1,6-N-acetylglucosamine synthase-like glycosyltransferase
LESESVHFVNEDSNGLLDVSLIVPCRNEKFYISRCLDSICANDYPKNKIEVFVIDGMSEDSSSEIVKKYENKHEFIRLINNPKRITACALNLGIRHSRGGLIIWMSAHNEYEKEYITKCVRYLNEYDADAVGGIIEPVPRRDNLFGRAVCIALSHPFGVGNSSHKTGVNKPQWADTAFGTCYKREVFEKIGSFNENLVRGQDMEFALRLKRAGLRNLLVPEIKSYYHARSDLNSLWRHYWKNGVWAILPFLYSEGMPVSWRHLVPLVFVSSLVIFGSLGLIEALFWWVFLGIAVIYATANLTASSRIAWRERNFKYLVVLPLVFVVLHVSYGLGSIWGSMKLLTTLDFWKKFLRKYGPHSDTLE